MSLGQTAADWGSKLATPLDAVMTHLQLEAAAGERVAACATAAEALPVLEGAGFLVEAARLVAHALPRREAVWWACMCARHTAGPAGDGADARAVAAAEAWVRKPTDENRRAAMDLAREAGFQSAQAWSAVAAFWTGDSMAPLEAPKVPPEPHFVGLAVAGAVTLAAVRGRPARRDARLRLFLGSARDIAGGGPGRLEPEAG